MTKLILKNDRFRKARGHYSRLLLVSCHKCKQKLCLYQKDGPGPLKRIYADRILDKQIKWQKNKRLICVKCNSWLGVAAIYKKEIRKCFLLFQDAVNKRIVKL